MAFTPKDWRDAPDSSTPLSAAALEDMELRLVAAGHHVDSDEAITFGDSAAASLRAARVRGIEADSYFNLRIQSSPMDGPELHWYGLNGAWFMGIDIANDNDGDASRSRDLAMGPIRFDSSGREIGVQDFLYFRNLDAPVLNIGGTPLREREARVTIMSEYDGSGTEARDATMATLRLRAATDQSAPAFAVAAGYSTADLFTVGVDGRITHNSLAGRRIREEDNSGRQDAYGGAGRTLLLTHRLHGESSPRFTVDANGELGWADPNQAIDTRLWRHTRGSLRTNSTLWTEPGYVFFGPEADASLRRWAAGTLATDTLRIKTLHHVGSTAGFYDAPPIPKPIGVPITAEGIHAALVRLGLIAS